MLILAGLRRSCLTGFVRTRNSFSALRDVYVCVCVLRSALFYEHVYKSKLLVAVFRLRFKCWCHFDFTAPAFCRV